jgi:hypothetical protein
MYISKVFHEIAIPPSGGTPLRKISAVGSVPGIFPATNSVKSSKISSIPKLLRTQDFSLTLLFSRRLFNRSQENQIPSPNSPQHKKIPLEPIRNNRSLRLPI